MRLTNAWQRPLDVIIAGVLVIPALPLCLVIFLMGFADTGSPIFFQKRVGRSRVPFTILKFRTMSVSSRSVPTHEMDVGEVTSLGRVLRRYKLDELPQLWNVIKGDMSLVGPRPCLPEQDGLIEARQERGVNTVRPGITGLAQVSGVTMQYPDYLARVDALMLRNMSLPLYLCLLVRTIRPGQ